MPSTPLSLLERLRRPQDGAAWSQFVRLYTPLLFRWARGAGLSEADAADLLQDVFTTLLQEMPRFVYQPGKTVSSQEILAAVKSALVAKGMDADMALMPLASVGTVTVASSSATDIGIREAFFDPTNKAFSAVVEIPAGDPI